MTDVVDIEGMFRLIESIPSKNAELYNLNFNSAEFSLIKNETPKRSFTMTPSQWCTRVNDIGITLNAGRYGGIYALKDIAFEFGMWISPKFNLLLINEFERLKKEEQSKLGWSVKRELSKINYKIANS